MNSVYQPLFQSMTLRSGVEVKNRIVMAPMTNFSSHDDGTVSDDEVAYYARRSGGVGMVITACANVTENGKGFHGEFAAHRDEMIPSLRRLAQAIQAKGAKAVLQIFHGGRSCPPELVPNGDVVSASAVANEAEGAVVPRALEDAEIRDIVTAFGEATRRAIEAGYDGVEIHGANGYLIQQFFSPHSNRRTDEWGGSLEKRMAFPLAIVDEVTRVVREHANRPFLVGYRFSPEEPTTPGITMNDTLALVDRLADQPLDYLHVSLMDFWSKPHTGADTSQTRLALIQRQVGERVPVMGVGSIHTPDEARKALETGVPLIALGRELIMEPDWVEKVEQGRESEIRTTLSKNDRETLVIPEPLWQAIINTPGWFPVV
ncbi:NADH-dependent flavin oxidoreductase [Alicyclobacillus acidoterrestris]|uniref:NADH-dependent flavin oxidoreductase n=1 Tax=Alicyclobacillus acidoterrestris (strain ATCC 49025 / DSM 3922 / CIP 106132 / NCIMB 13137 / GD3B) TaxID=1356854 RepID=T0BDR1_ALIAG|nr:NADH-dependent flavin oxidoreductase [Alicyclobacillus acidoterrestris]EPZ42138.1 NADH-dependent flavin oxidoreductase [Alicyclobacillus acidoterrestris ATCC 49025]UNO48691.1 NADH-dependent flavin oxidoreductase [Alicyclobacillus acidoterrestris]